MQRLKKMLGFIVANDNEEFLMNYGENGLLWSATPELAMLFPTRKKADIAVIELQYKTRLWVLLLFERKHQLILGSDSDEMPHWL
jgi:hypothetical protein